MTLEETITNEKKKAVEFARIAEQLHNKGAGADAYANKAKYHHKISVWLEDYKKLKYNTDYTKD